MMILFTWPAHEFIGSVSERYWLWQPVSSLLLFTSPIIEWWRLTLHFHSMRSCVNILGPADVIVINTRHLGCDQMSNMLQHLPCAEDIIRHSKKWTDLEHYLPFWYIILIYFDRSEPESSQAMQASLFPSILSTILYDWQNQMVFNKVHQHRWGQASIFFFFYSPL